MLVAEDNHDIAKTYEMALSSRGHSITITANGKECLSEYQKAIASHNGPFDVLILDYRMPVMNGYEAAEKILAINSAQRIIFASTYTMETLVNLIKENGIIAEILQKPFALDVLIDTVEDKLIYSELEKLRVRIGNLKKWNPSHQQLSDLLDALLRLRDPNIVFSHLVPDERSKVGSPGLHDERHMSVSDNSKIIDAILQNSLNYLGPEWLNALLYHLERMGVPRAKIAQHPTQFNKALHDLFGSASVLVKAQILKEFEVNQDLVTKNSGLSEFKSCLVSSDKSRTASLGRIQDSGDREVRMK